MTQLVNHVLQFTRLKMLARLLLSVLCTICFVPCGNCERHKIGLKVFNSGKIKFHENLIRAQTVTDVREWSMVVGVIEGDFVHRP